MCDIVLFLHVSEFWQLLIFTFLQVHVNILKAIKNKNGRLTKSEKFCSQVYGEIISDKNLAEDIYRTTYRPP